MSLSEASGSLWRALAMMRRRRRLAGRGAVRRRAAGRGCGDGLRGEATAVRWRGAVIAAAGEPSGGLVSVAFAHDDDTRGEVANALVEFGHAQHVSIE